MIVECNYPRQLAELAELIDEPALPSLTKLFVYHQLQSESADESDASSVPDLHEIKLTSPVSVFHSATATFYAPSDQSGIHGMRRERIRCTPSWRRGAPRRDCAFVVIDDAQDGFHGMSVVRVQLLFSFEYGGKTYPCALVEWFKKVAEEPDRQTGMWTVEPELDVDNKRLCSVLHLDSFVRGAHIIPVYGSHYLPINFIHTWSLDAFDAYHVNHFIDYHANEIIF